MFFTRGKRRRQSQEASHEEPLHSLAPEGDSRTGDSRSFKSQQSGAPEESGGQPRTQGRQLQPLDPYFDEKRENRRSRVRSLITRPVMSTVVKPTVLGEENVQGLTGAFIVIPNHSSHLDAPMVFSLLPPVLTERLATGAAADYFYQKKSVAGLTKLFFNTYPIERKGHARGKEKGEAAGMTGRLLRAGIPILVFPEGTRSRTGKMGAFKPGAAALASHIGIPLIPIAMSGGHEAMPVGSKFPKLRSEVFLFIGKPMYARPGEDPEAFMARAVHAIEAMLDQKTPHPVEPDGSSSFGDDAGVRTSPEPS
ncbi:MAG: lysophospholipid acyltransferase family protein [Actinomycetaceae bacterium]|nr:lysophospholipid acyltransferase family protein [Actinomycetaceae bacterium]MDY6082710.1 lysophospholipid acyltransferase family protein [Actinomycetaceae bacterium]